MGSATAVAHVLAGTGSRQTALQTLLQTSGAMTPALVAKLTASMGANVQMASIVGNADTEVPDGGGGYGVVLQHMSASLAGWTVRVCSMSQPALGAYYFEALESGPHGWGSRRLAQLGSTPTASDSGTLQLGAPSPPPGPPPPSWKN